MTETAGGLAGYLAMGGYAAFVWPSYGLAAVLLVALFLLSVRRLNRATRSLDRDSGAAPGAARSREQDAKDPGR
jgi:heme exporter protein D